MANNKPLDELLNNVLTGSQQEQQAATKLVQNFNQDLASTRQQFVNTQRKLKQVHDENAQLEDRLLSLQKRLREQQKNWAVERKDLQSLLKTVADQSQVLAERVQPYGLWDLDTTGVQRLADDSHIGLQEMRTLWQALVQQIVVSGRVYQGQEQVLDASGTPTSRTVTRFGPFNAVADDMQHPVWLSYLPEQKVRAVLSPQPELNVPDDGIVIDPSFGQLLVQEASRPGWFERLKPAGIVGVLIALIGLVGVVMAVIRLQALYKEQQRVGKQQSIPIPVDDNCLGRVMAAAQRLRPEFVEQGIDEAVLGEVPALRRGIGTLAVLAGIPPLLGLLGTVGGMIETFDVISAVGSANSQLLSGGIAQALLTTKLGLMAAIPLLLLHCAVKNKSNSLVEILEHQAAGMIVSGRSHQQVTGG
ncbi:MotA/TolQ/ExbB proton channel family protein [Endozoicomonadaceae bacterium StTr2]